MFVFEWSVIVPASIISAAISGFTSYAIAKHTSKAEIKKLKLSWQRQDMVSDEQTMQNLLASVSLCLNSDGPVYYDQALAHTAAALGVFPGKLGTAIESLHTALSASAWAEIEKHYNSVVTLYGEWKSSRPFKKRR